MITTFGVVLTALALFGIVVSWRRRHARSLALLWLACVALSLGSVVWVGDHHYVPLAEVVHGVRLSMIMPFTWFTRLPGLSSFREANRFTELALVPVVLLAGSAVEWLREHAGAWLIPVLVLALLETGWSGNPAIGSMPTSLPALDRPIAAQHTQSIVVDVPFGIRGGMPVIGDGFAPESMVLATADGHPLANALISRIPPGTLKGIERKRVLRGPAQRAGRPAPDHQRTVPGGQAQRAADEHRLGAGLAPGTPPAAAAPAERLPSGLPGRRRAGIPPGPGHDAGRAGVTAAGRPLIRVSRGPARTRTLHGQRPRRRA